MFTNRKLIIATKHKKEDVIAPQLEASLGVTCFTDSAFDTDILGTFTGEIERKEDPLSTARQKCLMAMEQNNCDLGVASEGSFGPHPSLFFASADDEFLIFIDKKNNLEISVRELSLETNFGGKDLKSEKELLEFAEQAKFPSHQLILCKSKEDPQNLIKGISDKSELLKSYNQILQKYKQVYVETDMRAMCNPTRMQVISEATKKLVAKIQSGCPKCKTPGFGVTDYKKGLPCELCGLPTKSTLSTVFCCQNCEYAKEELFPNGKSTEDPTYCDFCNP